MNKRIYYYFAVAIIALGLLVGCKSLTPVEATQSAGDETRTLIKEHVADETRAKQLIELVDQLDTCSGSDAVRKRPHRHGPL